MNTVLTIKGREKLVKARAGEASLSPITHMAFGNGAVDETGNVIIPLNTDINLKYELLRKPILILNYPTSTSCRYRGVIEKAELVGESINEIALIDSDGDIVAINVFLEKLKDSNSELAFEIDDTF